MNTFTSLQKSRIFILFFLLSFTISPGAFYLNAKNTGDYSVNNSAGLTTSSLLKISIFNMTAPAESGRDNNILPIRNNDIGETINPAVYKVIISFSNLYNTQINYIHKEYIYNIIAC